MSRKNKQTNQNYLKMVESVLKTELEISEVRYPTRQKVPDQALAEASLTKQVAHGTFSLRPQCKMTFRRIRQKS